MSIGISCSPSGSSPHARGTQDRPARWHAQGRFIPACAGNAEERRVEVVDIPVHPRMRGERSYADGVFACATGSSPHARGTRNRNNGPFVQLRFIPACAGNANPTVSRANVSAVHPRMRGERMWMLSASARSPGSSPHARGTLHRRIGRFLPRRFIPACAGNAVWGRWSSVAWTVHPRMRGERF